MLVVLENKWRDSDLTLTGLLFFTTAKWPGYLSHRLGQVHEEAGAISHSALGAMVGGD